jgi:hypothetical protein
MVNFVPFSHVTIMSAPTEQEAGWATQPVWIIFGEQKNLLSLPGIAALSSNPQPRHYTDTATQAQ